MDTQPGPSLPLLASKTSPHPLNENVLAPCPTMDLVAVASKEGEDEGDQLDVYRYNGQRAFGLKRMYEDEGIDALGWKFNGHYIAVGWHDGSVDVVSAENGETLKHFKQITAAKKNSRQSTSDSPKAISCIGWGVNFIDVQSVKTLVQGKNNSNGDKANTTDLWGVRKEEIALDDLLDRQPDLAKLSISTSLPDQIALIDVQSVLPKLPVLPAIPTAPGMRPVANQPSEIFGTQASLDAVIHNVHLKDPNAVDVLIVCTEDGTIRPVLYDSLALGDVRMPRQWELTKFRPMLHTSHPYSCSHLLLVEAGAEGSIPKVALVPFTLAFVRSSGINLHLVTSRAAQLQNLLQYLDGCVSSIGHYWNHSQDLPGKFMRNINETLAEKSEGTLVENLFHLGATGHCPATLKEWLVDELAERGHKRWDQAVTHGYTRILELTLENLLPAVERCMIVLTRLRGLATYHEGLFDISPQRITTILNLLACLQLVAHRILYYAGQERQEFNTFSRWLRHEIDVQATDPASQSAEETAEKDLGLDYGLLFNYIQGAMTNSKLKSMMTGPFGMLGAPEDNPSFDDTAKALEQHQKGASVNNILISISALVARVRHHCNILSSQITGWQMANSSMNCGLVLEEEEMSSIMDMRMVAEPSPRSDNIKTHIALVPKSSRNQICLHGIRHNESFTSIKCIQTNDTLTLAFESRTQVKDLKFADGETLIVLLRQEDGTTSILSIPYTAHSIAVQYRPRLPGGSKSESSFEEMALPKGNAGGPRKVLDLNTQAKCKEHSVHVLHVFPSKDRFRPLKLEVNGRKGRRVLVVLAEGGREYRVLDLDGGGGERMEVE